MLLVLTAVLLLVSLLFYMISVIDGGMFGTPEDEIDSIIEQKMEQLLTDSEFDESDINQNGPSHVGDNFNKIQMALKLIPNMDQETFLLRRFAFVGGDGYTGMESGVDYDQEAIGDENSKFFEWNGANKLSFPNLNFDEAHVPVGDSTFMCLGVSWITMKKRNQYDKYIPLQGLDECHMIKKGHSQVEEDYPKNGLNFKLWRQHITKGDSYCAMGIYTPKTD